MSEIVGQEKPPITDDTLQHYGVKGMKWGVRKASDNVNAGSRRPPKKKITSQDVTDARIRDASRVRALQNQADKVNTAKPGKAQAREAKKFQDMQVEYLKNPDRATALRMTNGEKAAVAILATVGGAATYGGATAGAAIGTGVRVGVRKAVERDVKRWNDG